jgi:hypothetical protein
MLFETEELVPYRKAPAKIEIEEKQFLLNVEN